MISETATEKETNSHSLSSLPLSLSLSLSHFLTHSLSLSMLYTSMQRTRQIFTCAIKFKISTQLQHNNSGSNTSSISGRRRAEELTV